MTVLLGWRGFALACLLALAVVAPTAQAQDDGRPFFAMRPLDFSMFDVELDAMDLDRIAELDDLVLEASLDDLTASLDAGAFTSYELTLYYLHRIREFDVDQFNTVVDLNPGALEIAQNRDEERAAGQIRSPLHGIPVVLKDNIGTDDYFYTSAGAMALANELAGRDAFLVEKLRDAGAIMLAKVNMTEWANWMHYPIANGYSAVGGQVASPYSSRIDPSGSSTGAAVAVTANFAPIAIGTETIGSIISPSARSSVVGYKPSLGLVSQDLIIPITDAFDTAGPIGRSVTDVATVMDALAAEVDLTDIQSENAHSLIGASFTNGLSDDALAGVTVGLLAVEQAESDQYQIDYYDLWDEVAALEDAGATVVIVRAPSFPEFDWGTLFSCDIAEGVGAYLQETNADFQSLEAIRIFNEENPGYIPYGQERFYEAAACTMTTEETAALAELIRTESDAWMTSLFDSFGIDTLVSVDDLFSLQYSFAGWPAITVPGE